RVHKRVRRAPRLVRMVGGEVVYEGPTFAASSSRWKVLPEYGRFQTRKEELMNEAPQWLITPPVVGAEVEYLMKDACHDERAAAYLVSSGYRGDGRLYVVPGTTVGRRASPIEVDWGRVIGYRVLPRLNIP